METFPEKNKNIFVQIQNESLSNGGIIREKLCIRQVSLRRNAGVLIHKGYVHVMKLKLVTNRM